MLVFRRTAVGGNYSNYLYACGFLPELLNRRLIVMIKGHEPKNYGYTLQHLKDKGATVWADTIRKTKELNPTTTLETLIPDFQSHWDLLYKVIDEKPEVVSHNMETVKRLYRKVRPQAKYERSLEQIQKTNKKIILYKNYKAYSLPIKINLERCLHRYVLTVRSIFICKSGIVSVNCSCAMW